jgi:hypothetical protein
MNHRYYDTDICGTKTIRIPHNWVPRARLADPRRKYDPRKILARAEKIGQEQDRDAEYPSTHNGSDSDG